jgi:hypothetical protein
MLSSFAVASLMPVLGCSGSVVGTEPTSADCTLELRYNGATYVEIGFADPGKPQEGQAEISDCDDGGSDPAGATFADESAKTSVWKVRGLPLDSVVAIKDEPSSKQVRVFASKALSDEEIEKLRDAVAEQRRD